MQKMEMAYAYWLVNGYGLGVAAIEKLFTFYQSAEEIYRASEKELETLMGSKMAEKIKNAREHWEVEEEYQKLMEKEIQFFPFWHECYPGRLCLIPGKPAGIYVKGRLPMEQKPAVAVIGTRNCSQYGIYVAQEFAAMLAKAGVEIVSGMARGIDSVSQQSALSAGGNSYAVLGCGVDICYPQSSRVLYEQLKKQGGILSSYPPGTVPKAELFPPRNRIISGLSDVVLVVEASLKSGTMITVDMALEQGKEVYVVPGRLTDRCSDGCNHLIGQGAHIVLSPEDMLKELGIFGQKERKNREREVLSKEENALFKVLDFDPKSIEQIKEEAKNFTLQEVMQFLIQLCMKGQARCINGSFYVKSRGAMKE